MSVVREEVSQPVFQSRTFRVAAAHQVVKRMHRDTRGVIGEARDRLRVSCADVLQSCDKGEEHLTTDLVGVVISRPDFCQEHPADYRLRLLQDLLNGSLLLCLCFCAEERLQRRVSSTVYVVIDCAAHDSATLILLKAVLGDAGNTPRAFS